MIDYLDWDLEVRVEEIEEETIRVDLSGEDRDLVLCNRAEVLESLQYLLNRMFARDNREGQRILVDCDGYRARRNSARARDHARSSAGVARSARWHPIEQGGRVRAEHAVHFDRGLAYCG